MKRFLAMVLVLCLVLGMGSISVFAATVGETLPVPEEGWKRAIGTEFIEYVTKTGQWSHERYSYNASAGYNFKFVGDKIRLLFKYSDITHSNAMHVKIDGNEYRSEVFTKVTPDMYLAIEVLGLDKGEHTVEVLGTYVDPSHHISVYPVDIPTTGYIVGEEIPKRLSVLLNESETTQLSTSYNLANNTNFTWTSADETIATVDANGKVTAVAIGETEITVQNADATFKESIPVKVIEMADEQRLAVHLRPEEKAKLYLAEDPSTVTWTSLDESVVTVGLDGQLIAVAKGLAIVKAELEGETYQVYVRVNS